MEPDVTSVSGKFWKGVAIAIGIAVVSGVLVGIIQLWIEYGYFNPQRPATIANRPDSTNDMLRSKQSLAAIPKDNPPPSLQPELKPEPLKQPEAKMSKAEPAFLDLTFEHFAQTYESLSEKDRATYLQGLAGKTIQWTGYIGQMYLTDNYFYMWNNQDSYDDVLVNVSFTDAMRLSVGPLKSKIRVSGVVEIRQQWVVIHATELTAVR
jgi:hypothetical protein